MSLDQHIPDDIRLQLYRLKSEHQQRVEMFMQKCGQAVPSSPAIPDPNTRLLRAKLIFEEAIETINALGVQIRVEFLNLESNDLARAEKYLRPINYPQYRDCPASVLPAEFFVVEGSDLTAVADGCADLIVVTTGTLSACGIADVSLQEAVDVNNLEKFQSGYSIRGDGKLLKSPQHQSPNILDVLWQQGADPEHLPIPPTGV